MYQLLRSKTNINETILYFYLTEIIKGCNRLEQMDKYNFVIDTCF